MDDPRAFRRGLAARIAGLLGSAALAACSPSDASPPDAGLAHEDAGVREAGGAGGRMGTGGGGGAGGAVSEASAGSAGGSGGASSPPPVLECFPWAADAGSCPTDMLVVLNDFIKDGCPSSGWFPYEVDSPPMIEPGQCCYMVELTLCPGGGRPFLVDGRPRTALPRRGSSPRAWDSAGAASPLLSGLGPGARAALADAWTADALLEHASVASFSRLSLALLASGAPADLVASAHRAALDELRHAQLCFALASAYAGEPIEPGPFPLADRVHVGACLAELAASSAREGCVGETVAAVMAAEQLARTTDPAVRAALEQIAADEARHAELSWRIVAWAMHTGGSHVRVEVARALAEAISAAWGSSGALAGDTSADGALERHGRLGTDAARATVRTALVEVVATCAKALFAQP